MNGRGTLQTAKTLIILACCTAICKSVPVEPENEMNLGLRRLSQTRFQPDTNSLGESMMNQFRKISPKRAVGQVLYMAALNKPTEGYMRGIPQADQDCYRQGYRGLLKRRTFRAFLSSRDQDLQSIIDPNDRDLPIVNIKGEILFNSWNEMFNGDGAPFSPNSIIYSFNRRNILTDSTWPEKAVWHGSTTSGDRAADAHCNSWRKYPHKPDRQGFGSPLDGGRLLNGTSYSCDKNLAVLCIETTKRSSKRRRRDMSN